MATAPQVCCLRLRELVLGGTGEQARSAWPAAGTVDSQLHHLSPSRLGLYK